MGDAVNSEVEDYGPTLNPDASMLLFSSKRKVRGGIKQVVDEDLTSPARMVSCGPMRSPCPSPSTRPTTKARPALRATANHLFRPLRVP
jgi:hypothetical protein